MNVRYKPSPFGIGLGEGKVHGGARRTTLTHAIRRYSRRSGSSLISDD